MAEKVLELSTKLFSSLNAEGVRYCHWKSNEHLRAGLSGETDLDLLVDEKNKEQFQQILENHGFKPYETVRIRTYPQTENYLGFDDCSGELLHLHVHWKLILGTRIKEYELPWANEILNKRQLDNSVEVYKSPPHIALPSEV